ncbi:MAG: DsrE family protein [Methanosarcinales archaeon]
MKNIVVIIRNSPFNTIKNSEGLRMSVGLTLKDDKVTVVFMDNGVWSATELNPEVINAPDTENQFSALKMLNCKIIADAQSLEERNISKTLDFITIKNREEISKLIAESDIVIPF